MKNILALLLLSPMLALAQNPNGSVTFDQVSDGNWVALPGYSYNITVQAWGGGGGGGSSTRNAGGGGGGAYASRTYTNVMPGTYTVSLGLGGVVGGDGGATSFSGTGITTLSAAGGSAGLGCSNPSDCAGGARGLASSSSGSITRDGGNGGSGKHNGGGGGGGGSATAGVVGGNGADGGPASGGNGGTGQGAGGAGGHEDATPNAVAGTAPGGGGGGRGTNTGTSQAGAIGWVIVTVNSALPIELGTFNAKPAGNIAELSWTTATESNNSHFAIERGTDARTFSEIGQVRGAGTTQEPQSYTFTDEKPLSGTNYYRLRQVDYDGTESFSPVLSVVFGKSDRISIAPSPATDRVRILLEEAPGRDAYWKVYDSMGREIRSGVWEVESAEYELDVNELPEGMYTFRLEVGASVQVKQFRKL